jgi:hypothetical protein
LRRSLSCSSPASRARRGKAIEAQRQRAEATAQARESALQRDVARFEAQRAEASSEFMSLMLEEVGPGRASRSRPLELVDRGVQMLDRRYSDNQAFAARMLVQMSRRYMDLGNTDKQWSRARACSGHRREAGRP